MSHMHVLCMLRFDLQKAPKTLQIGCLKVERPPQRSQTSTNKRGKHTSQPPMPAINPYTGVPTSNGSYPALSRERALATLSDLAAKQIGSVSYTHLTLPTILLV